MLKLIPKRSVLDRCYLKIYTFNMNKIIFILLFMFSFSAVAETAEPITEFKNPIFGLPMQGYSRNTNYINQRITPTSIIDETNKLIDSCELLENNETNILMKCVQNDQNTKYKDVTYYVQYKSVGLDYFDRSDCIIQENMFKIIGKTDKSFKSYARFFIPRSHLKNNNCGPVAQDPILQ